MIASAHPSGATRAYRLKVTLAGIRPPVWRRLVVPGAFTLDRVHAVIQIAMGWHNCHLHHFDIAGTCYGLCLDPEDEETLADERSVRLDQVVRAERARFRYVYDFADAWRHDVLVERIGEPDAGPLPRCTAGRRAAPPEGCGGSWAYADLLAALADATHPAHAQAMERTGGGLDPERADLAAVNRRLRDTEWQGDLPRA